MLPVILVMVCYVQYVAVHDVFSFGMMEMFIIFIVQAATTTFAFLGPLHDNPFQQSRLDLFLLSIVSLAIYLFLFWAYEVSSLLGIFSSAVIVSLVLHPVHALLAFCCPNRMTMSCNPCVWLYQLFFLRHHHLKVDDPPSFHRFNQWTQVDETLRV